MLRLGVMLRFAAALRLGSIAVAATAWAFAPSALAQAPAEDALKRIIEEGNPAYVDWSGASGDWAGGDARTGPVPKSATATTATTIRFNSMPIFDSSSLGFL